MGFGCARFATLTIAPPHPKGAKQQGKKAIYRKKFTPALEMRFICLLENSCQEQSGYALDLD